ncbi:hypothetical protein QMG83_10400 [Salinibacterium sp. G-O1]|uniref:DUF7002 family protein n=1 Tax=Salinibacterium sp. G-O1 TaxID=3046208 RepID=UPI0024B98CB0|nr:hypothetical protein [Salinibacterium sp. G-O1]MDJ0335632.1 hypothetical protein [Salinibacterium sp. G-O1]
MLTADLTRLYPEAYHMAADGSWPSIARHGLLSTAALVERWEIASPGIRSSLLEQRRPDSVAIEHPEHGVAIVRDHKPINETALSVALIGMTPEQWFEVLNERVFFFLQRPRLESLLGAYSKAPQLVITVDTASLVAAHEERIELCRINSGFAQPHNKAPRNRQSFLPIADYPHRDRAVANPRGVDIAELTVLGGVPDIAADVVRVERMLGGQVVERLV